MGVIKNLRIKIILIVVLIQIFLLAAIFITLIFSISRSELNKSKQFIEAVALNGGHLQQDKSNIHSPYIFNKSTSFNPFKLDLFDNEYRKYFSIHITKSGAISRVEKDFPLDFTRDEIFAITDEIIADCNAKIEQKFGENINFDDVDELEGEIKGLLYCVINRTDGTKFISVMNRRSEVATIHVLSVFAVNVFMISVIVTFILAYLISGWAIKPTKEAFETQKRFVADAGHELKTPVAVIGANLDVIMSEQPNNRWLQYIREENERMGHLVKNLLYLARKDSDRLEFHASSFDFSSSIKNAILPFESVIFEDGKMLELGIRDGLRYSGDEQQIKQIAVILVDNAIKNSEKGALIRVSAVNEKDKIVLRVFNTGHGIKKDDLEKIFGRFYRSDTSRARKTGGYGLGLAIAKTNAELHNGTLVADSSEGNWAEFTLTLPLHPHKKFRLF